MGRGRRKTTRKNTQGPKRRARPASGVRWCAPGGGVPLARARAGEEREPADASAGEGEVVQAQVRERLQNLRLLAAVAAEVPVPSAVPGLAGELEGLSEYDRLLTLGLDAWDREGEPDDPFLRARQLDLFAIGARIRGQIRALLPWELRARVQTAWLEACVEEADVWKEVEALRASGRDLALLLPGGFGPNGRDPLPRSGTIEPWLRQLPVPWLRTIAARHGAAGVPGAGLLRFVIGALRDDARLAVCLGERLDGEARRVLARFTAAGEMLRATLTQEEEADLAPDWDGRGPVPEGSGVRLRAHGLLYIGTRDGFVDVVVQPDELRVRLSRLLLAHHEDALSVLGPRRRDALEAAAARQAPRDRPH